MTKQTMQSHLELDELASWARSTEFQVSVQKKNCKVLHQHQLESNTTWCQQPRLCTVPTAGLFWSDRDIGKEPFISRAVKHWDRHPWRLSSPHPCRC